MKDATFILSQLQSGALTPEALLSETLSAIESHQEKYNAATAILREEAQAQLRNLPEGPLKGLPMSVKECYALEGKQITSGSVRMKPIQCAEDAEAVKRLKKAGAVIVSRGNTSEFLAGRETDNLRFGTTRNAINPVLTAGGSSGGEGVLVGTGCVTAGIGTDIGGSCRFPAVFNGIVGFKPASGQIDKTGIFPAAGNAFAETMNSPGILCRSVRDVRLLHQVLSGNKLSYSSEVNNAVIHFSPDFRVSIKDESISKALKAAQDFFRKEFPQVRDTSIPESGRLYKLFALLFCGGFTDKIYEWSRTEAGEKLSYLGELFRRMRGKPTISNELFSMLLPINLITPSASKMKKVIAEVSGLREKYYSLLGSNGILVLPTSGVLAPPHRRFVSMYNKPGVIDIITPVNFCNALNLSCITLPAWKFQKSPEVNPPAVQLVCAPGSEELLLNVAEKLWSQLN